MGVPPPTVEQLFAEFRRTGEPALLGAVFDATSPELLALARRLAADPLDAEDAVQATFLTALQKAHRFDPQQRLVPWLVGILRLHVQRQRSRQLPDPSRLLRVPVTAPDDSAAGAELLRSVEAGIARLPQRYRVALALKLLHGLSTAQIAALLGESRGAVRLRVHRGLKMLRESLPKGIAGLFAALFPAAGLAALRSDLLDQLVQPAIPPGATGVIVMKKSVLAVASLLCIGALFAWLGPDTAAVAGGDGLVADDPLRTQPVVHTTDGMGADRVALTEADPAAPSAAPAPAEARADVPTGDVRVRVVDAETGRPLESVHVLVVPADGRDPSVHGHGRATDPSGEVTVRGLAAGRHAIHLDRRTQPPEATQVHSMPWRAGVVDVVAGAVADAQFQVHGDLTLLGLVVDPDGRPVPHAAIWCAPFTAPPHPSRLVAIADAAGAFRLAAVGGEHWICARAPGFAPSRAFSPWQATDPAARMHELRLQLGARAGALRGRVVDDARQPVADAVVLIGPGLFETDRGPASDYGEKGIWAANAAPALVRVDPDGRFELAGVAAGSLPVRAQSALHPPQQRTVEIDAGATAEIEIVLQPGISLVGRVLDPDGAPVAGARIAAGSDETPSEAESAADGTFRITGLPVDAVPVRASASGYSPAAAIARGEAGATVRIDFTLVREGRIEGVLCDAAGVALADWTVQAVPADGGEPIDARTGANGAFHMPADAAVLYRVAVASPLQQDERRHVDCTWLGLLNGGGDPIEIRLPPGSVALGKITGRLVDAAGRPLAGGVRARGPDGSAIGWCPLGDDGAFALGPLVPCAVRLIAEPDGERAPLWSLGAFELGAGVIELGEVRAPAATALRLQVTAEGAQAIHGYVSDADGATLTMITCDERGACTVWLAPGAYVVQLFALDAFGAGRKPVERRVQLTAGEETVLKLEL